MSKLSLLIGASVMFGVLIVILAGMTEGMRKHRIGVTLMACWSVMAVGLYAMQITDNALPGYLWRPWLIPVGMLLGAWALWDLSRLSRHYGTTTLIAAADIARGLLAGDEAHKAVWAAWVEHLPKAAWLKGPGGVMVAINRHYEARYGTSAAAYQGSTDASIWGADVAHEFGGNDQAVFDSGRAQVFEEPAPVWHDRMRSALCLKFPVRDRTGQIIGVGGLELILRPEADEHEQGGIG